MENAYFNKANHGTQEQKPLKGYSDYCLANVFQSLGTKTSYRSHLKKNTFLTFMPSPSKIFPTQHFSPVDLKASMKTLSILFPLLFEKTGHQDILFGLEQCSFSFVSWLHFAILAILHSLSFLHLAGSFLLLSRFELSSCLVFLFLTSR